MSAAVYKAEDVAELTGSSPWLIYKTVRDGTCPFPFIRLGRRLVFPKAAVDQLLGIGAGAEDGR